VRTGAHMIYDGSDPYSYKAQLPLVLLSISNYLQDAGASIRLTTLLRDLAARELGGSTYGSHIYTCVRARMGERTPRVGILNLVRMRIRYIRCSMHELVVLSLVRAAVCYSCAAVQIRIRRYQVKSTCTGSKVPI
jgi:hypothetical protein